VIRRDEVTETLRLAVPVVLTQLGHIAMTTVDTIMVGRLGAEALSAVALGGSLSITVLITASGVLMGLDPLVAQAYGAGRHGECGRAMRHGLLLATLLAVPAMLVQAAARPIFVALGQEPDLAARAADFVTALNWSTFPFLAFMALRQFLQGVGIVKPAMIVVLAANLLNLAGNWVFIFGHLGFPALGATGSAWATTASRAGMCLALAAYVFGRRDLRRFAVIAPRGTVDRRLVRGILVLGGPVGMQYAMEVGVFSAAAFLMGWLGSVALAGHQIAINVCSITFMVPYGVSATAAVRVGHALGRDDVPGARRAALVAYALGAAFMACAALVLAVAPGGLARIYTADRAVARLAADLLLVGAAFQLFDGAQTIGIGALRGAADTRVPMIVTIVAYWGVALPLGWLLAFPLGWGPRGLWWGLASGLAVVAVALAARFHARVRSERLAWLKAS
jgi:MATE family multidrug resistance protein